MFQGAAFAAFREKEVGTLTPGQYADFVVLSEDLFAVSQRAGGPSAWSKQLKVLKTFVGGECKWGC